MHGLQQAPLGDARSLRLHFDSGASSEHISGRRFVKNTEKKWIRPENSREATPVRKLRDLAISRASTLSLGPGHVPVLAHVDPGGFSLSENGMSFADYGGKHTNPVQLQE